MQVIYIALEIDKNETITKAEIAELFSIEKSKIDIKPMLDCKGDERAFRLLCDYYLWTNRYWHGIHESKLTCLRVKAVNEIAPEFLTVYSTRIRFAIRASSLSVIKINNNQVIDEIKTISNKFLDNERIEKLSQYRDYLEEHYEILRLPINPYL